MTSLAQFDGYTLRHANQMADVQMLEEWIEADDAHREIFTPSFFLSGRMAQDQRAACYALEDEHGVVMYIRLSRAERVYIQFPPETDDSAQKMRLVMGLFKGMAFLENQLSHAGCEEWIFDTMSEKLRRLAQRRLGFTESTHELVRPIRNPGAVAIADTSGANGATDASRKE